MRGNITMAELARAAGVSMATASRALSDHPKVAPATRARVQAVASDLGYVHNSVARTLRTNRSYTLGLVSDQIATTPYAGRIILGAQEAAARQGWLLLLLNSGGDPQLERREIQTLLQRQVDGLLYAAMYHQVVTPPAALAQVPSVLLDARSDDASLPSVVPDEVGGARAAVAELLRHGHRRIGFVTHGDDIPATHGRLRGYQKALLAAGVPVDPSLVAVGPSTPQGGYPAALALLDRPDRPSALFCFNDRMAMGAYQAAAALGLRVPEDVSVIGFDNQESVADALRPGLTTMALPHYEMGVWAVEVVLARVHDAAAPVEHAVLPCPLVVRESVAAPPPTG
ncbi:MAG TPA: LacI family DNA-binding transcriptional regulator [Actinomycetales bacterium]|nr:LacI family DNA-binding transcriptional regulator [Actinomycetales bacterium]